ncbi:halovibrin HvnA [Aliivibrio fischeri]|uniref:halovibrin HvnA n=1 Tax=Aliivibrio fischeri TaxID=668 RepID=UPI0012D941C6|nr:halovibrin HvnA [Aliivibrio fischeri]MUL01801.1 halovibrin HvnA [Aliivibrio fischeri]
MKHTKKLLFVTTLLASNIAFAGSIISQEQGDGLVQALTKDYNQSDSSCGGDGSPSFLCTGVMLHGSQPTNDHVWNPTKAEKKSDGVSFSYLRHDSKYSELAYRFDSGYIVYQIFGSPSDKIDLEYNCFFPVDGSTDGREFAGCGAHENYPSESGSCESQGIHTAYEWKEHYKSTSGSKSEHQCSFDVRDGSSSTSYNFAQGLAAMKLISDESMHIQNEVRASLWQDDIGDELPIQAFFYLEGSKSVGLKEAKSYQEDYYKTTGIAIPVIKLTLPNKSSEDAKFKFSRKEQAI